MPNVLDVRRDGDAVVLEWDAQSEAAVYRPTRTRPPLGGEERLSETSALIFVDAAAAAAGIGDLNYLVPAVDICGNESPRLGIEIPVLP